MISSFIKDLCQWAYKEFAIEAIVLVGSFARGTQKIDSDIDLIILTSDKQSYVENPIVFSVLGEIDEINIETYGECTSVRVWYKSGLNVEFGIVSLKWVDIPLDEGTQQVLSGGYKILVDKTDLFAPIKTIIPDLAV